MPKRFLSDIHFSLVAVLAFLCIVGIFNLTDHSPPQILSFDETKRQMRFDGIVSNNHRSSAEQAEPEKHCEEASEGYL